jgi:predicted amidohydrolase YtcJ
MQADVVLRGGTIYTMDRARPRAAAVGIGGGRILGLGDDDLDEVVGPGTRVIDLRGRAIVPGFVDAHVHFGHYAIAGQQVDLDAAPTLDQALRALRLAGELLPPSAWLQGRGWDRNRWGRLPTRTDLDAAVGHRRAALASHDGHALWLSSTALAETGIDRYRADPAGGVILRDASGEPTGVLFETAQDLVRGHIPVPDDQVLRQALRQALQAAASFGLTGIHNFEGARTRRVLHSLESEGGLTLRIFHGLQRDDLRNARDAGLNTGAGSEWLRIGPVKLFADGALGSRTALLLEPYEGRQADGYRGVATLAAEELAADMRTAAEARLDVAVHAIGDAAVRMVLDAFEATRATCAALAQRLLRIEHAQLVHPRDVPRFAKLGAIASMQPIHATADWRAADAHWGARTRHGYAWRDLLGAGVALAFGTDAPVESIEPLHSLYAATTRRDANGDPEAGWYPAQCLELEDAVRAYTTGSAMAERAASRRGKLAPGMDADLVVLGPDPFMREPAALRETRVQLTMVGGRIAFEALP